VLACPPSAGYRFGKFARRNKGRLVTASLLAAVLFVAVGGVGWAVRDRSARQARVTTQVELILSDTDRLMQEQQWDDALDTVRRAEVALAGGEVDAAVEENIQTALKELEFVERLTEIRMETSVVQDNSFDYAGAMQSYGQAFRDFGVDVESLPVATAVAHVQSSTLGSLSRSSSSKVSYLQLKTGCWTQRIRYGSRAIIGDIDNGWTKARLATGLASLE